MSFDVVGHFRVLLDFYQAFANRNTQALWESSHVFPIDFNQRQKNPDLARHFSQRKNRRSQALTHRKVILHVFYRKVDSRRLRSGSLVGPRLPSLSESGRETHLVPRYRMQASKHLQVGLGVVVLSSAYPWRDQIRGWLAVHNGSLIPCILGKSFGS